MTVGQLKRVFNNLSDDVEIMLVFKDNEYGCMVEDLISIAPANKCTCAADVTGLYLYAEGMRGIFDEE